MCVCCQPRLQCNSRENPKSTLFWKIFIELLFLHMGVVFQNGCFSFSVSPICTYRKLEIWESDVSPWPSWCMKSQFYSFSVFYPPRVLTFWETEILTCTEVPLEPAPQKPPSKGPATRHQAKTTLNVTIPSQTKMVANGNTHSISAKVTKATDLHGSLE